MGDAIRTLLRTSFTNLSFTKTWLMRLALLGVLGGGAALALGARDAATVGAVDVSHLSCTSGAGFVGGVLAGATVRLFLKVVFVLALAFVALGYGLSYVGLLDLPWGSWGEALSDVGKVIEAQAESAKAFFTGLLPAGSAAAVGLGAGLTQKPRFDDDTD